MPEAISSAVTALSREIRGVQGGSSKVRMTHAEAVRTAIESDIFAGRLPPGSRIDEAEIAKRFEVSRTPVREAMLQLIESGLIVKQSRQRATVAKLDVRRLLQTFEALSELEGLCARFAARRMTGPEKDELIKNHQDAAKALAAGDEDLYFYMGRRFHALIMRGTHSEVLLEITNKLVLPLVPYRRFQIRREGRAEANQKDHQAILEAILKGNAADAYELVRQHNTIQGDVLAEYISMSYEITRP